MLSLRSPIRRLVLAVALIAAGALAAAGSAAAAFPGANGRIAFDRFTVQPSAAQRSAGTSWRSAPKAPSPRGVGAVDTSQIWSVNPDGSLPIDLSGSGFLDEAASWSPTGTKVAFDRFDVATNSDQIWVMNPDGSGQTNLTNDNTAFDSTPAWSPDGTKIAYSHSDPVSGANQIWVMNADGSGKHQAVPSTTNVSDGQVSWSPDGTRLSFTRTDANGSQIWIANADGSGAPLDVSNDIDSDTDPNWSPDGTKIAFGKIPATSQFGDSQVWVMNADGTGAHAITAPDSSPDVPGSHFDSTPAWSPDGTAITYERQSGSLDANPFQTVIWAVSANGTGEHQVSTPSSTQSDFRSDWQPVGAPASTAALPASCSATPNMVVHASDPTGLRSPLNVHYKIDGGAEVVLPADASGNAVVVMPNGKHILEYWGGDAAGYQEAHHHGALLTIDTVTGCLPPRISVAGVRRACVTSVFSVRVKIVTRAKPRSVRVYLGKKRLITTKRTSFRLNIDPRKLARRTRLRIVAVDASGHVTRINRTIARCAIATPRPVAPRFTG